MKAQIKKVSTESAEAIVVMAVKMIPYTGADDSFNDWIVGS